LKEVEKKRRRDKIILMWGAKKIDKEEEKLECLKGMSVPNFLIYSFPNFHYILF